MLKSKNLSNGIGTRLKFEMEKIGINSTELARRSGVLTSFLYDVIREKSNNPSTIKLAKVAEALGVSLTYLASGSRTEENFATHLSNAKKEDYIVIPYLKIKKAINDNSSHKKTKSPYSFQKEWLKNNFNARIDDLRILVIKNNRMQPALHSNDIIIIDTSKKKYTSSGIYILFDGQNLSAIQTNSNNQPALERSKADISVVGCVVWLSRTI